MGVCVCWVRSVRHLLHCCSRAVLVCLAAALVVCDGHFFGLDSYPAAGFEQTVQSTNGIVHPAAKLHESMVCTRHVLLRCICRSTSLFESLHPACIVHPAACIV